MRIDSALIQTALALVMAGCAHQCPPNAPGEACWAEAVARHRGVELAAHAPVDGLGCYRLDVGPSYLPNAAIHGERVFIPGPRFIELRTEWYTKQVRSGFLVRTPPGLTPWGENGVWRPTRDGGAIIDLGTGFSGLILVMHRDGLGYSGTAATYQDVGDESDRSTAQLWPVPCPARAGNRIGSAVSSSAWLRGAGGADGLGWLSAPLASH